MIEDFGWSIALGHAFAPFLARGFQPARVIVQHRGIYLLVTNDGEYSGELSGRLQHDANEGAYPIVGDWVAVALRPGEGKATIHAVLPRRTAFARKAAGSETGQIIAANVDIAFLVTSMNLEFNPRRLERYLATAWESGARPVVVLTKADLADDDSGFVAAAESVAIGVAVIAVSALTGQGMEKLATQLNPGKTCVLVGSSGVGKSSLVNALAGRTLMETGEIRDTDARGKHTTTHRQLVMLAGGALLLDTPGMRALGLLGADAGLANAFDDVAALANHCRFGNCGHSNEPGCAIRHALDLGKLDTGRWRSFLKLQRELAHFARKDDRLARESAHKSCIARTKNARIRRKLR